MKQRARIAGVLANPFRFVEAGEEFEHATRMSWADPVDAADQTDPAAQPGQEPPARRPGRPKRSEAAGDEADPI